MPSVIFLDHLDTGAAVLGDLIDVRAFEQAKADVSMPQTVAGAGMTTAVEFQVQLVENRVHQLARRFPENPVGRLESLALSNPLERQDRAGHRLAEADAALAAHTELGRAACRDSGGLDV